MQFAPKQAVLTLNEAQKKKVENMGRFITTMYINDLTYVNFSDAQAQNVPNINILFPYGAYLQNEQMMQLADTWQRNICICRSLLSFTGNSQLAKYKQPTSKLQTAD